MADVAKHVRIFEAVPTDDFVTKRIAVTKDLGAKFLKDKDIDALLGVVDGVAQACAPRSAMPEGLVSTVEGAIRAQSTSFVSEGNEVQLVTMALLGLNHAISTSSPAATLSISDVLATGAWLALSLQPPSGDPKLEELRQEVLAAGRTLSLASASHARKRRVVDEAKIETFAEDFSDVSPKILAGLKGPVGALRENAILDREEIDFLWWAMGDYSTLMAQRLSSLSAPTAALAAGWDAAQILRRLPAEAHRHVVLRHVREYEPVALSAISAGLGSDADKFVAAFKDGRIAKFPAIFGLLATIAKAADAPTGNGEKAALADWAGRALLEAGFLRTLSLVPGAKI
ncbi:hypothetical protein QO010_004036 [Caulobacter ginsengisoli]|uniref:GTPase-associated system helical domain-containing protein n=1 Tax=Caulobacter ginsengisoli TaxID=400775 RepID=A0ABU0IYJ0_9CAUL|nr:GTPase-associated system all-helical protein GASH [Caulobacter ginsengisoli]MDQ0466243.1 hypothetical protein [Caulobacter ginsengisoli]